MYNALKIRQGFTIFMLYKLRRLLIRYKLSRIDNRLFGLSVVSDAKFGKPRLQSVCSLDTFLIRTTTQHTQTCTRVTR